LLRAQMKPGPGLPLAATVKLALLPAVTVRLAGWVVKAGAAGAPLPPPLEPQARDPARMVAKRPMGNPDFRKIRMARSKL